MNVYVRRMQRSGMMCDIKNKSQIAQGKAGEGRQAAKRIVNIRFVFGTGSETENKNMKEKKEFYRFK